MNPPLSPLDPATRLQWSRQLRALGQQVGASFDGVEQAFLATGDQLRQLNGQVTSLTRTTGEGRDLLSSAEMGQILAGLEQASGHLALMQRPDDRQGAALGRISGATETVLTALGQLSRIMGQVLVLAVNAKIEAAQLSDTGTDFTVFTSEIARLARTGEQTITAVRQELSALKSTALQAQHQRSAFEEQERPELARLAGRLEQAIRALHSARSRAARGAGQTTAPLTALVGHIGALVSEMQIFDATRQRLEHIEQALTRGAQLLEADDGGGLAPGQERVLVNSIAELQGLQLAHAGEAYHQALAEIGRNLAAMAEGATQVDRLCREAFGGDGQGSLQDIGRSLRQAGEIFLSFSQVQQAVAAGLAQVTTAAGRCRDLLRALNGVNGDMRLMGLNAAIKCGNMGTRGRVLSVIAQELQGYASQTREQVEHVTASLGQITEATGTLARETGSREAGTGEAEAEAARIAADGEAVRQALDQRVASLQETAETLCRLLDQIARLGASVAAVSTETSQGFATAADRRERLGSTVKELQALARTSDPGLSGEALAAARRAILTPSAGDYTMASERLIHGAAVSGQALQPPPGAPTSPPAATGHDDEPDISDLLF